MAKNKDHRKILRIAEAMKRNNAKIPRLYKNVLQAIADLGENPGSTTRTIINQVQGVVNASRKFPRMKDVTPHVERALTYGLKKGMLLCQKGRYKLNIDQKLPKKMNRGSKAGGGVDRPRRRLLKPRGVRSNKPGSSGRKKRDNSRNKKKMSSDTETSFTSTIPPENSNRKSTKKASPKEVKEKESKPKFGMDFTSCPLDPLPKNIFQSHF